MCAILGLRQRTTMDIDATAVGLRVDAEVITQIVNEIAAIDVGDGILFRRDSALPASITKDDEYGGYSIGLTAEFGTIRQPLSIDVTYGDAITPSPEFRDFTSMIDNRLHMQLLSYTVETVMAEKIQSILKRGVATTRPRDFYDLHMLHIRGEYVRDVLALALQNTIVNRSSEKYLKEWRSIVSAISTSDFQKRQWNGYQRKMSYARDISFDALIDSLEQILTCVCVANLL